MSNKTFTQLLQTHHAPGHIEWIGVRPARREPVTAVDVAEIRPHGLTGDHRRRPGKRAVTLIQWEHLPVIAALAGTDKVTPERLRRNICVSGINVWTLRNGVEFTLGEAVLRGTGICAPCSLMEKELGDGGYNAMRGHGGITAEVIRGGLIRLGDALTPLFEGDEDAEDERARR